MKKIIIFLITLLLFIPNIKAEEKQLDLYLFYGDGCPHCKALEEYLDDYLKDKDNIKLHEYEIWYNEDNQNLFKKVQKAMNKEANGIPYLVIGEDVVQGFMENYTEEKINGYIKYYQNKEYTDKAGIALGLKEKTNNNNTTKKEQDTKYEVPILGKIDAKKVSLPLLAVVIGAVDGFNPCAMWILLFLISMLLGMHNKKKMIILGLAFIFTSGLVYLLFMLSFLNISSFINNIKILRLIISLLALSFGLINVNSYFKSLKKDTGCEVVDQTKRKKIVTRIKKIVSNNKFILSLIGIIILAASVNLIELLCSLGLPVIFTEILSLNNLNKVEKSVYILIYILFFLIDDIIIFLIAIFSSKITAISNKYTKYSHLIGGLIMIIIGILMLIKPEWLMFNF